MIVSNNYIWGSLSLRIFLDNNKKKFKGRARHSNIFVRGDWILDYNLKTNADLIYFNEQLNKIYLKYKLNGEDYERKIIYFRNKIIDQTNIPDSSYSITPKFLTSFHFRKWKIDNIKQNKIIQNKNNFYKKGLDNIIRSFTKEISEDGKKLIITINDLFPKNYKIIEEIPELNFKNKIFKNVYNKSMWSLLKLVSFVPYKNEFKKNILAGYPFFPSVFGRDTDIANFALVYYYPELVKENIEFRLNNLGNKDNLYTAEEKGKALHEFPLDELTNASLLKNFPNYIGCDESSLLLISILRYDRITKDHFLLKKNKTKIKKLWNYIKQNEKNWLIGFKGDITENNKHVYFTWNHTWRDNNKSIVNSDGSLPEQPLYTLWDQSCLFGMYKEFEMNDNPLLKKIIRVDIKKKIKDLKKKINEPYWMEDKQAYALALDKNFNKIEVINSDVVLGLYYKLFDNKNVRKMIYHTLENKESLRDKYGLRTVSKEHKIYDIHGYHLGAVWPWQNVFAVLGYTNYGYYKEARNMIHSTLRAITKLQSAYEVIEPDHINPHPRKNSCEIQAWTASAIPLIAKEFDLKKHFK